MKTVDKFGNPIYPKTYSILVKQGKKLIEGGYRESKKSPNLFYKRCSILVGGYLVEEREEDMKKSSSPDVIFFADMRGTDVVKIWEDTDPLFYWRFKEEKGVPDWLKRRLIEEERKNLEDLNVTTRLSFFVTDEPDGLFWGGKGDGFCEVCGKDFRGEGRFCSKYCEQANEEIYKKRCARCGKELKWDEIIEHHLDYDLDKTIDVCKSCHVKIHKSKREPSKLRPCGGDPHRGGNVGRGGRRGG